MKTIAHLQKSVLLLLQNQKASEVTQGCQPKIQTKRFDLENF